MYWDLMIMEYAPFFTPPQQVLDPATRRSIASLHATNTRLTIDAIVSGSWDKTFRIWDPQQTSRKPTVVPVPEKIFTMDIHEFNVIVGMAGRLNYIYDLRKLDEPVQRRDSSLKFMTRCIKFTPSGDGTSSPFCLALHPLPPSQEPAYFELLRSLKC